tara:strand:- start:216 stop:476 length:261 start_codon:yes stop_codon:yes gene_type:complete
MNESLQNFHNTMAALLELEDDLSPVVKIVVLLRVTIEYGLQLLGMSTVIHILSTMLKATVEFSEDNPTMHYEQLFDEIDEMSQTLH